MSSHRVTAQRMIVVKIYETFIYIVLLSVILNAKQLCLHVQRIEFPGMKIGFRVTFLRVYV